MRPIGKGDGANKAHGKQQRKHEQNEQIHLPLHSAPLAGWQGSIHHHLVSAALL